MYNENKNVKIIKSKTYRKDLEEEVEMSIGNVMQKMLDKVNKEFPLTEKSAGEFANIKAKGMKFQIKQYEAKGLGNVSVMEAKGFFGLMQMDTLIINPLERDLPLFSYDRVMAMGNDTLIIELYDTFLKKQDFSELALWKEQNKNLPEHDLGEHWYDSIKLSESVSKKGKKEQTKSFDQFTAVYFEKYLNNKAAKVTVSDTKAKKEKASVYVEGLLSNGGPSTDVFKKEFGEPKTAKLFRKVLFGTEK